MYWTLELASKLEDAPWPASKDELIDYAIRSGAPMEVIENLQDIEMMKKFSKVLKTFGLTIPVKMISSSTRTSIDTKDAGMS